MFKILCEDVCLIKDDVVCISNYRKLIIYDNVKKQILNSCEIPDGSYFSGVEYYDGYIYACVKESHVVKSYKLDFLGDVVNLVQVKDYVFADKTGPDSISIYNNYIYTGNYNYNIQFNDFDITKVYPIVQITAENKLLGSIYKFPIDTELTNTTITIDNIQLDNISYLSDIVVCNNRIYTVQYNKIIIYSLESFDTLRVLEKDIVPGNLLLYNNNVYCHNYLSPVKSSFIMLVFLKALGPIFKYIQFHIKNNLMWKIFDTFTSLFSTFSYFESVQVNVENVNDPQDRVSFQFKNMSGISSIVFTKNTTAVASNLAPFTYYVSNDGYDMLKKQKTS